MDGFATHVVKDAKVCFLGEKCRDSAQNAIEAEEVESYIASEFVRIR